MDPLSGIVTGGQGGAVTAPPRFKRVATLAGVGECNEATDGQSLRQSQRQAGEQGQDHGPDPDPGLVRPLVLVVDDSDLTRKMLCRMMRVHGYDCEEAEDGVQAVERVRRNLASSTGRQYAVVLMDFVVRKRLQCVHPHRSPPHFTPSSHRAHIHFITPLIPHFSLPTQPHLI